MLVSRIVKLMGVFFWVSRCTDCFALFVVDAPLPTFSLVNCKCPSHLQQVRTEQHTHVAMSPYPVHARHFANTTYPWPGDSTDCSESMLISALPAPLTILCLDPRYDSNKACFLAAYPEVELGHAQLPKAVNKARVARGECVSRRR